MGSSLDTAPEYPNNARPMKEALSFLDRLRLLISGTCELVTYTTTENRVGWTATTSAVNVEPPRCLRAPWERE